MSLIIKIKSQFITIIHMLLLDNFGQLSKTLFYHTAFLTHITNKLRMKIYFSERKLIQAILYKVHLRKNQLPTSAGSSTKQEFQKNIYFCFIDYAKAFVDHNKLWKVLKEMGIPDHLTCLLRNLYAGQEATVRTGYGTTDWVQIGKRVHRGCILSPCLFNLYAEYIRRNAGLEEA